MPYIICGHGSSWSIGAIEQWDIFDGEEKDSAVIWYEDSDNITYKVTLNSDGSASKQSYEDIPKITLTINETATTFTSSHTISEIKQIVQDGTEGNDYLIITSYTDAQRVGEVSLVNATDERVIFNIVGGAWFILTSDDSVGLICPSLLWIPYSPIDNETIDELTALTSLNLPFQLELAEPYCYYSLVDKTENTLTFVGPRTSSSQTYDFYKATIDMQSGAITYTGLTEAE